MNSVYSEFNPSFTETNQQTDTEWKHMVGLHFEYSSFTVGWIKLSYKNSTNWFTVGILTHVRRYISLKWFFNYEVKIFEMTASLFLSCIENTGHRHYCVAHFWSWSDVDIILEGLLLLELWEISVLLMWNDEVYFILWKTYSLCKKFRMSDALLLFYYDKLNWFWNCCFIEDATKSVTSPWPSIILNCVLF